MRDRRSERIGGPRIEAAGRNTDFLAEAVANTLAHHAGQVADVVAEHTRVLRAIGASDAEAADRAMRDHLAASASRMALLLVEA